MASYNLRIVILPRKQVFAIAPGREAPDRRKAASIDPHRRIVGGIPRRREECRDHLVKSLCGGRVCLADVDAVGRVGELKIVYRGCAENLAQLGHGNASWLAP